MVYHWIVNIVPCPLSRTLFFVHSICNSLHLLTPTSQSLPYIIRSLLATTILFSMSMSLSLFCRWIYLCHILDSNYKWYHIVFISFWLTSLSMIISSNIQVAAHGIILLFFMAKISLHICTTYFWFIHLSMDTACFHILAVVNSAAMNIGWMCLFESQFCLDICPGVGLLDHMLILFVAFWGTYILLSTVAVPIYIPTKSKGGFPFPHNYSSICYW